MWTVGTIPAMCIRTYIRTYEDEEKMHLECTVHVQQAFLCIPLALDCPLKAICSECSIV